MIEEILKYNAQFVAEKNTKIMSRQDNPTGNWPC